MTKPEPPSLAEPISHSPEEPIPPISLGPPSLPSVTPPPMPFIGQSPLPQEPPPQGELNARQRQLLEYLKIHGRMTRKEYVQLTSASVPTAARDLKELVDRGLIRGLGPLARGRYYVLA